MEVIVIVTTKFGVICTIISSMFAKFSDNQRSLAMSSIKYLNFKFLYYKNMHKE